MVSRDHFEFDSHSMSNKAKWQKFRARDWEEIRGAWLAHVPVFPSVGARPDPGLERLTSLLEIDLPEMSTGPARKPDVEGIRRNALWEAVFLFHKCAHINLAAQRLGQLGMHSWCMFNAYHSAYLGARGIMALFGVALPNLGGSQVGIDLFPEHPPLSKKAARALGSQQFEEFLVLRLPLLDQRDLWEAFQRILQISKTRCLDDDLRHKLLGLSHEAITPPRNHFLYKAHFWLLDDLASDAEIRALDLLVGTELDTKEDAFLLRLSFCVYYLFEQLMRDLGNYSAVIKAQIDGSRFLPDSILPELGRYKAFLSQVSS
jgi:hypothetical protein